jgi:hypothetical protein
MLFIITLVLGACITIPITPASCEPWFMSMTGGRQDESVKDEYGVVTGVIHLDNNAECLCYALFDFFCFHIFLLELLCRMWALADLVLFFSNPFSAMDFLVVMLDVVVFFPSIRTGLANMMGGTSGGTRALRIIRLARLARLVKVMRLMKKMRDELSKKKEVPAWKLPDKFHNTGVEKLTAMTAMVKVITQAANIGSQRQLQALLGEVRRKTIGDKALSRVLSSHYELAPQDLATVDLNSTSGEQMLSTLARLPKHPKLTQNTPISKTASSGLGHLVRRTSMIMASSVSQKFDDLKAGAPSTLTSPLDDLTSVGMKSMIMHMIMYEYSPLVQEAIVLLMTVHSSRTQLLNDVRKAHVLFDDKDIDQQEQSEGQLNFITQQIEKMGLWNTDNNSEETDLAEFKMDQLQNAFYYLTNKVQTRNPQYEMGLEMYRAVHEVQVILRDLECDIAYQSWRHAIGEYPNDSDQTIAAKRVRKVCMMVNTLMVGFARDNLENQERVFRHMAMVVADVRLGVVGSAEVLAAAVANNEVCMRLLPADFPKWMLEVLRDHGSTFATLSAILHVGRTPIKANAIRVMTHLAEEVSAHTGGLTAFDSIVKHFLVEESARDKMINQGRPSSPTQGPLQETLSGTAEFRPKRKTGGATPSAKALVDETPAALRAQMSLGTAITETADNSPSLRYHLLVLDIMCDCAAGATNIVEARIQSVLEVDTVLKVMVDESVPLDVRVRFIRLFYEAMIEVQVPVHGLALHPLMWIWLASFPKVLRDAGRWIRRWHKTLTYKASEAVNAKAHDAAIKREAKKNGRSSPPSGRSSPTMSFSHQRETTCLSSPQDDGNGGIGESVFSAVETKACRLSVMYTFESVLPSLLHFFTLYYNLDDHLQDPFRFDHLDEMLVTKFPSGSKLFSQLQKTIKKRNWPSSADILIREIHAEALALREVCLATENLPSSVSGVKLPFSELSQAAVDKLDDFAKSHEIHRTVPSPGSGGKSRNTMTLGLGRIASQMTLLSDSNKKIPNPDDIHKPTTVSTGRVSIRDNHHDKERDTKRRNSAVGGRKFSKMLEATGGEHDINDKGALLKRYFRQNVVSLFEEEDVVGGNDEVKNPLKEYAQKDMNDIVEYLVSIPRLSELVEAGGFEKTGVLRLEPLVQKLVRHTRGTLHSMGERKFLAPSHAKTAVWVMRLFRSSIEHGWGFSILERDEEGDEESDANVKVMQDVLTNAHAPEMCIDFIARGVDKAVVLEAIRLLVALLYREGGNQDVQSTINKHLMASNSMFFFTEAVSTLETLRTWAVDQQQAEAETQEQMGENYIPVHDLELPDDKLLLTALQLSCEGHYGPNQDVMRVQPNMGADESINLLDKVVEVFQELGRFETAPAREICQLLLDFILESIQGPCTGNQDHFAQETELLETMNEFMRTFQPLDAVNADEEEEMAENADELKTTMLLIFKALLEGQGNGDTSMIYERVISVIHIEVLQALVNPPDIQGMEGMDEAEIEKHLEESERIARAPMRDVQVEALVLIEMLRGYSPSISGELSLADSVQERVGSEVVSVEVIWHGTLQRRFFHVPELCKHLVKTTRTNLVETVNRDNQDSKLTNFVEKTDIVLEEVKHQEQLKMHGLSKTFSRTNQNNATWLTFGLNILINIIYLLNLRWDKRVVGQHWEDGTKVVSVNPRCTEGMGANRHCYEYMEIKPDSQFLADLVVIFNILQVIIALFTLVLFLVVRAPVSYQVEYNMTGSKILSFVAIWTKSMTPYYVAYLLFAIFGMGIDFGAVGGKEILPAFPIMNTCLLFDVIVKSSTSAAVLMAVIIPFKQVRSVPLAVFLSAVSRLATTPPISTCSCCFL